MIVDADLEDWYEFDLSATECIHRLLIGDIQLDPFEGLFAERPHRIEPIPQ